MRYGRHGKAKGTKFFIAPVPDVRSDAWNLKEAAMTPRKLDQVIGTYQDASEAQDEANAMTAAWERAKRMSERTEVR